MQTRPRRICAAFNRLLGSMALLFAVSAVSMPSYAALIFEWSFTDGIDTVSGEILGLVDNAIGQTAVSVTVDSAPLPYLLGDYATGEVSLNSFSVTAGVLTSYDFFAIYPSSTVAPNGVLSLYSPIVDQNYLDFSSNGQNFTSQITAASAPTIAVPEPSPIALLGAGVIAFGALRRKKRKLVE